MPRKAGATPAIASRHRIDEHLALGRGQAGGDGQHRDAGAGVIVAAVERQRPGMGRRPQEDDEEEDKLSRLTAPVTAAQPIIGGEAPAAPPMTMFCGVRRFSHIV